MKSRRLPEHQFQHQFDRDLGQQCACAWRWCSTTPDRWPTDGKIGALRTAAARPRRPAQSRSPRTPATSTSRWFRSRRTSTSAAATVNASWIDWNRWDRQLRSPIPGATCSNCITMTIPGSSCLESTVATPGRPIAPSGPAASPTATQPYDQQRHGADAGNAPTLFPADEYYENSEYYCNPATTRHCS